MNKWYCLLAVLALVSFCAVVDARDIQMAPRTADAAEGGGTVGQILSGHGAGILPGDVIYRNDVQSGYYFRPYPGYRDHDMLWLENGGEVIEYTMWTFGSTSSGSQAGSPYDAAMELWEDSYGDPNIGLPLAPIVGTECVFVGVPVGHSELTCLTAPGTIIPDALWSGIEFSTDNSGWKIAGGLGTTGFTQDVFGEHDLYYDAWSFFWFGGCPVCGAMTMEIIGAGQQWACCDPTTYSCTNIYETECDYIHVEDVLCNDMDPPCSEAGACCDALTGVCTDTFASLCTGFKQTFTAGDTCFNVEAAGLCPNPEGVPTVTQWGMIVLTGLLLAGLTVKFGRRNAVTA